MQIKNLEELLQALGAKKVFKADGTLTKQAEKAYDKLVNILWRYDEEYDKALEHAKEMEEFYSNLGKKLKEVL